MALGSYIKKQRLKRKLNLRQLAKHAGVSHSYLSQVEADKFTPHPDWLKKMAKALNMDPDRLMKEAGFISKHENKPWWETEMIAEGISWPKTFVPIVGSVPAQNVMEAFNKELGDTEYIEGSDFAIQVKGNSLIKAAILDGDICYIKKKSSAKESDLVLAIVDDKVVLRFFRKKEITATKAKIIGIKVAILRK